jgi:hypothetical protein
MHSSINYSMIQCDFQLHIIDSSADWHIYYMEHRRSDSKVMRLVPKKSFILFIHQLRCIHLQSASLVPAHTFSSGAAILCSIPGTHFVGHRLRPALLPSGCLLLTQNGVLSLLILLFEIKRSRKVRDQVLKQPAASP